MWSDHQQDDCYGAIVTLAFIQPLTQQSGQLFSRLCLGSFKCVCLPAIKFPHLVSSVWVTVAAVWKEDNKKCELGALLAASLDCNRSGVDIWSCLNHLQACYCSPCVWVWNRPGHLKLQQQARMLEKHQGWTWLNTSGVSGTVEGFMTDRNESIMMLWRRFSCFSLSHLHCMLEIVALCYLTIFATPPTSGN